MKENDFICKNAAFNMQHVFELNLIGLQPNMMNFALRLTANREEAKDLMQETTLRVLNNKEKYYENVNFKGWVFTIMHNIFVNNYRRAAHRQTIIDQSDNSYYLNTPQDSGFDSPEGAYTLSEISRAMNSLNEEYKVPFLMFVRGYKYTEIADTLDLPIGTVKSRLFLARRKLQDLLKDYEYTDRE